MNGIMDGKSSLTWWASNSKWMIPTITFLLGVITTALISYFAFMSRLDTMEFKIDYIHAEFEKESKNIYGVFHEQHKRITGIDTLFQKLFK